RPDRSPSRKAARPRSSNPRIQYSTVLGASPNNDATSGQVLPWATSSRPCSRWSYRDSSLRRISSCNARMMVSESATVSGFILPGNHRSPRYAITYDAVYSDSASRKRHSASDHCGNFGTYQFGINTYLRQGGCRGLAECGVG